MGKFSPVMADKSKWTMKVGELEQGNNILTTIM